jgi:pyridoxal 5'-phosphate synthase pdxT subunit
MPLDRRSPSRPSTSYAATARKVPTPSEDAPLVGVLALQGAFREHRQAFERLGMRVREVRLPAQLEGLAGLAIPGGESTTMAKLMHAYGLHEAIRTFHAGGGGVLGTCAGAIAVATDIEGQPNQPRLGLIDMRVARNAYGRQVASFECELDVVGIEGRFHGVFIRAPRMLVVGPGVTTLAVYDGDPVAVASGSTVATVCHPELSCDDRFHALVLERWGLRASDGATT